MPETKIGVYKGMEIHYSSQTREFVAYQIEETSPEAQRRGIPAKGISELMRAKDQTTLERQIDRFLKAQKHFPIRAFYVDGSNHVHAGQITSFKEDPIREWHEVWFSYDKTEPGPYGSERGKHRFQPNRYFRETPKNLEIAERIRQKEALIKQTEEEIEAEVRKFEKPITKADLT